MKIKSTDSSYCTVKNIKISGNIAYITLLIMSNTPQSKHCAFSFWVKDIETNEYIKANNNRYWIDRCNSYDNYSGNIDINMYKEIILKVDITKANTASMQLNRWVRHIQITLKDSAATQYGEDYWISEELELLSDEIILPELSNLKYISGDNLSLNAMFNLSYSSQEDFNYTNNNLLFKIQTRSVYDNHIIEEQLFSVTSKDSEIKITFEGVSYINDPNGDYICINGEFIQATNTEDRRYTKEIEGYDNPVYVDIIFMNLKEEVLFKHTTFFKPYSLAQKLFIKNGVVKSASIKLSEGIINIKDIKLK